MKIVNKKKVVHGGVAYEYVSYDESFKFVCDKCLRAKVAKKVAIYTNKDGETKRICNSCYSNICQSKG